MSAMDDIRLKAGTIVHVNGFPFKLLDDTTVLGTKENYELARSQIEQQRSDNLASSLTECIDRMSATPQTDTYTDDEGNVWLRPTAWAYFAACRALRLQERDAARYRWLRSDGLGHIDFEKLSTNTSDEGLDCAIDIAMAKAK